MLKVLSYFLCDLDPKVKVIGQNAGICDGVPSTSALVVGTLTFVSMVNFRLGIVEHGRGYSVFIMLINVKMSTGVGI